MRRYSYKDMQKQAQGRVAIVRVMAGMDTVKTQIHSEDQWQALFAVDARHMKSLEKSGRLRFTSKRKAVLSIG